MPKEKQIYGPRPNISLEHWAYNYNWQHKFCFVDI